MEETPPSKPLGYRAAGRTVQRLDVASAYERGSLTLGTLTMIGIALVLAWFPRIHNGRMDFTCERERSSSRPTVVCTLESRSPPYTNRMEGITFRNPKVEIQDDCQHDAPADSCARLVVYEAPIGSLPPLDLWVGLGRRPASMSEAKAAAASLEAFFKDPAQKHVHVTYGPAKINVPWTAYCFACAFIFAASLVVRWRHRATLIWDPQNRYLVIERRRWPFRTQTVHVPDDTLVRASIEGREVLDTVLHFASGRMVSFFGRTVANRKVHERAVERITRFLSEQGP